MADQQAVVNYFLHRSSKCAINKSKDNVFLLKKASEQKSLICAVTEGNDMPFLDSSQTRQG